MIWSMKSNKLKRFLYILILLSAPILSYGNDQVNTLFSKGNAFYAKGQYKEAITTYQSVLNDGYQSAGLYFNLGNAYYKSGDVTSAILYYEKAHKLSPGDEDINFNIRFANLKTTDKIDEAPEFFLESWWRKVILTFSISTLAFFTVLLVLSASAIFIVYLFGNSVAVKKSSFYTSVVLFSLALFTWFISGRQSSYFNSHKQAVVFSSSVTVKSGPNDGSGTLFVLHDGTKINILENYNNWIKIKLVNGNQGWVKARDIKEI